MSSKEKITSNLVFLKLGGSLITDKHQPHTARVEVIRRLCMEIAAARENSPKLNLLLGHGSGSYGHVPAREYGTRQGVKGTAGWLGFIEVWREAMQLNRLLIDALQDTGLPALTFPPSACVTARDGKVARWNLDPIQSALKAGLIPVVFGDVVFDTRRGGTILSTEDLLFYLALAFRPEKILLAGIEPGIWRDFPECTEVLDAITLDRMPVEDLIICGSTATDVTGGMASKVQQSLNLVRQAPGLTVMIFSGDEPDLVKRALLGTRAGTLIHSGF